MLSSDQKLGRVLEKISIGLYRSFRSTVHCRYLQCENHLLVNGNLSFSHQNDEKYYSKPRKMHS